MKNKEYISTGELCIKLGISLSTVYRWIKMGKIKESFRTLGEHRRFDLDEIKRNLFPHLFENKIDKKTVTYARVSSHDQIKDLKTQEIKLALYCKKNNLKNIVHISDLGSGLNYNKKGFKQLLNLILKQEIDTLIINHKDRLLRFGSEIIFNLCKFHKIKVIIIENEDKNFEEDLVSNVIEIMTVFCAKMYGRRSHKNKNKNQEEQLLLLENILDNQSPEYIKMLT